MVTDHGDGTVTADVTYTPEDKTITNSYAASGSMTIEASKALAAGSTWPEGGEVEFTLKAETAGAPMPAEADRVRKPTAEGPVSFGEIGLTQADGGKTYT